MTKAIEERTDTLCQSLDHGDAPRSAVDICLLAPCSKIIAVEAMHKKKKQKNGNSSLSRITENGPQPLYYNGGETRESPLILIHVELEATAQSGKLSPLGGRKFSVKSSSRRSGSSRSPTGSSRAASASIVAMKSTARQSGSSRN